MKIIQPGIYIAVDELDPAKLKYIERYGRICYQSEGAITPTSHKQFINTLMSLDHLSVLEHEKATVIVICDRGITHEIVRHRIAGYSQESTRWCNYHTDKFGREISVIEPFFWEKDSDMYDMWFDCCRVSEYTYMRMLDAGATPQQARSVLPNSLKTQIAITYNFREWLHFLGLRCAINAHPQMRQIAIPLCHALTRSYPEIFDRVRYADNFDREFPKERLAVVHYLNPADWAELYTSTDLILEGNLEVGSIGNL